MTHQSPTIQNAIGGFSRAHSRFDGHVVIKLCVQICSKLFVFLDTHSILGIKINRNHIFRGLQEKKKKKNVAQITGNTRTPRSQYGAVPRAGRHDFGARRTNVATDVGPLVRDCRSWY